ncbi:MAG: DUF6090 family protein [Robiginitalea sp.]
MLRFFRQIRQRLLTDNKFSKYLLYAVGEILLVVIGILIALQVNNWNTVRSEEKELNEYLLTIAENIQSDLPVIQSLKNQRDSMKVYVQKYWTLSNKEFYEISDASALTRTIIFGFEVGNFNSNQSGFESLKTSGLIGKIQGTDIAESIFGYYRKVGIINNLADRANTFTQAMQAELMKQDITPEWGRINGSIGAHQSGSQPIDPVWWKERQGLLKKIYRHPTAFALMARHGSNSELQQAYGEIYLLGFRIVRDIESRSNLD